MSHRRSLARLLAEETRGWSTAQRAALSHRLHREVTRLACGRDFPTAGALAKHLDPGTVQTPALKVVDEAMEWALNTRDARLAISFPPQEGKTTRVGVFGVLRALVANPERRIILASYSDALARQTSRASRNLIKQFGSGARDPITGAALPDKLGLALAEDKAAASSWQIAGHRGGLYAVGVGGSLTGSAADVLIIDDPLKGMAEADSKVERDNVITWWESVAQTRLAPGAPVIIIQTRWHEDDLVGYVLRQDRVRGSQSWRVVNIPAVATPGVLDTLGRPIGEAMISARGRTKQDFQRIREDVGERVWAALYLGAPTPVQGGLFAQEWFDRHRSSVVPAPVAARIVSVDPAETAQGDEAGIIGLSVTPDGRVWVTDDRSGRMQSDKWARQAVILALELGAGEVLFEAFTTGPTYERIIRIAWQEVRDNRHLIPELTNIPVPIQDEPPFLIRPWRAKGDKTARAAGTRQAASTGRLRMVGTHTALEAQATMWQQGQASPDRLDALVNGFERCMQLVGAQAQLATPTAISATLGAGFWSATVG